MPTFTKIDLWKGDTFTRLFRFKAQDGADLDPVDLSDSVLVFHASWPSDGGSIQAGSITKSSAVSGWQIPTPANGEATLRLTDEETATLPIGKIRFSITRLVGPDKTTLIYGALIVGGSADDD